MVDSSVFGSMQNFGAASTADAKWVIAKIQWAEGVVAFDQVECFELLIIVCGMSIHALLHCDPVAFSVRVTTVCPFGITCSANSAGSVATEHCPSTHFITALGINEDGTNGNEEVHNFLLVSKLEQEVTESTRFLGHAQWLQDDSQLLMDVSLLFPGHFGTSSVGFHMRVGDEAQRSPCPGGVTGGTVEYCKSEEERMAGIFSSVRDDCLVSGKDKGAAKLFARVEDHGCNSMPIPGSSQYLTNNQALLENSREESHRSTLSDG